MAVKKVRPDRRYKKPWVLSYYGTDKKRRYEYFNTKDEARERENEIGCKKRGGGIVAPSARTFQTFAERYVESWKLGKIRGKRRPKPSTSKAVAGRH